MCGQKLLNIKIHWSKRKGDKNMYEEFIKEAMNLEEASTSRIHSRLNDKNSTCAIISPYRGEYSEKENKQRMTKLKSDVRSLGYGFNQFVSRWVEDGEAFDEESLLIPDITKEQAFKLGQKYEQSSVIIKDEDGLREICTTPFESYSVGETVRTFNTGNHMLNVQDAEDIFSKRKGGPASMPKKGSNKKPFSLSVRESVRENFELYEMEQPRPSYHQNKYRYKKIF